MSAEPPRHFSVKAEVKLDLRVGQPSPAPVIGSKLDVVLLQAVIVGDTTAEEKTKSAQIRHEYYLGQSIWFEMTRIADGLAHNGAR